MNEAVMVKKGKRGERGLVTLSSGVQARIVPVSQAVIQESLMLLKEPQPPMWFNPEKEREEPNPMHPDYRQAVEEYRRKQFQVTFDTFALFGVELVDGVPEDDDWLKKLRLFEKRGHLDLSKFDLEDEIDREFLYKKFVAMNNDDYLLVGALSGINPEEVRAAADSFRAEEAGGEDHGLPAGEQRPDGD